MRSVTLPAIAVVGALAITAAAAQQNRAPDASKLQVLILTGQNVGEHQWRTTSAIIKETLENEPLRGARQRRSARGQPGSLAPYDLVLVNYYNRTPRERWGEVTERALEDFVRSGKGLVLYHVSLAAFEGWTDTKR